MTNRYDDLVNWYRTLYPNNNDSISIVSGDASFRKFYRCSEGVLMDAPPQTEKNTQFVEIANLLQIANIKAPVIKAVDYEQGFLLVSDLGNLTLANYRTETNLVELYKKAIDVLVKLSSIDTTSLPCYDEAFIAMENNICKEWYFEKNLQIEFNEVDKEVICEFEKLLITNDLQQKQIAMHRDFHSRNIMVTEGELALVDFQDMVNGPLLYDLMSLMKDCYYVINKDKYAELMLYAYNTYKGLNLINSMPYDTFIKVADLTVLQRHYKCLGIFSRLAYRDNKKQYLEYIPTVLNYIKEVCSKYEELQNIGKIFNRL
jgi:aminoglycoside/choline kinase family phosphotransferase